MMDGTRLVLDVLDYNIYHTFTYFITKYIYGASFLNGVNKMVVFTWQ